MEEKKVSLFSKLKKRFLGSKKSIIPMTLLTIGSVFALSTATFAWFFTATGNNARIQSFAGDLDVTIDKVTAYKYVYPYHRNSNEFVDYESAGTIKSYVVEDSSIPLDGTLSNSVTIALGVNSTQPYATSSSDANIGPTKVHYETSQDFKYYLLGNDVFNGDAANPWSTLNSTTFARREAPVVGTPVSVTNILVSAGAEFVLFDASTVSGANCDYFTYTSITPETNKVSRFQLLESNRIKCLKSGIYQFDYRIDSSSNKFLDITLISRGDSAIFGTNLIDPTKITIDYAGGNYETYENIDASDLENITDVNSLIPYAVQEQKTMVVVDVQLQYQNKNPIDAGLELIRDGDDAKSIYNFTNKYSTTDPYTYLGYQDDSHRNPLRASDFYAFYFEFAKEENAYTSATAAWNHFHEMKTNDQVNSTPLFAKFSNDPTYIDNFDCTLHPKTINDSTLVPGSSTNNVYHCYIVIDYDYEYMRFFVEQNRLGITYLLDRDFGFYYTAVQHIEGAPSQSSSSGGE